MAIRFGTTQGLRGYFAVMWDAKTGEPIQTGFGSYKSSKEAARDAAEWAEAEGEFEQAKRIRQEYKLDES